MNKKSLSRRDFIKTSAALGAFTILPSYVALGQKSSSGLAPSEKIRLAVIGIGNQGDRDRVKMLKSGLCDVVALCDIDSEGEHTHRARYEHGITTVPPTPQKKKGKEQQFTVYPNKARFYRDFRKMFDEMADQIDAVLIATPDHSHFSATMLAMSLGKHVYVEKPLAHTFGQCERLMDLASRSGVVTQMGNQGHSGANYFQFKKWFEAGVIKDVHKIICYMNEERRWHGWGSSVKEYPSAPIPKGIDWDQWHDCVAAQRPYSENMHPQNWRSWYEYGCGALGDWAPHLFDTSHRFLQLGLPKKVTVLKREGPNPFVYPQASTLQFDFPERNNMPACQMFWYDGVHNKPVIEPELGAKIKKPGKLIYSKDLVFQGGSHSSALSIIPREKFMEMRTTLPRFPQRNSDHYKNFLLACKGKEESRSPFSVAGELTQVMTIGILAQRFGGEIQFDRASKRITNNDAAQALLDPAPRKGWEEFYRL